MKSYFENLFAFEAWANKEIADCLLSVNPLPGKAMSVMSHIINAQKIWLCRIKNEKTDAEVWEVYDKSDLGIELKKSTDDLKNFVSSLNEENLNDVILYTNTKGESFESVMHDILTHLIIHSSYHRGQIILEIKPLVKSLPYTDYINYVRTIRK